MIRQFSSTVVLLLLISVVPRCSGQIASDSNLLRDYPGDYRSPEKHTIGIDHYITEDKHEDRLIYADYATGVVRLLSATPDGFSAGPEFAVASPVEIKIGFVKDKQGSVTGLTLQRPDRSEIVAQRIPLGEEEVTFQNGNVRLAGTLLTPRTKGPHPAIILLHGSEPLTRYSFGPYPHFFTSLGFVVLIYDKRSAGASTGQYLEQTAYYPDGFTADALAALDFVRGRQDVNPLEIGFWGSSEGGMLTTQVASRSKKVAFVINSSGFMVPLWQQVLYHIDVGLRDAGFPQTDIDEAVAYNKEIIQVGRTGKGWERFQKNQEEVRNKKWFVKSTVYLPSLEATRWRWIHLLSFDPLPRLQQVKCPVLGVFGELDNSTPVSLSVANMKDALAKAGNRDHTLKVFPHADHPLMVGNKDMAPGVFDTISAWLLQRVHLPE